MPLDLSRVETADPAPLIAVHDPSNPDQPVIHVTEKVLRIDPDLAGFEPVKDELESAPRRASRASAPRRGGGPRRRSTTSERDTGEHTGGDEPGVGDEPGDDDFDPAGPAGAV